MPDSSPTSDRIAGFIEWAKAPYGKPKSTWEITREDAYELIEQLEAAQTANPRSEYQRRTHETLEQA